VDEAAYYYLFEWLQVNDPGPRQAPRGFGLRDCRGQLVLTMDQLMMALENGGLDGQTVTMDDRGNGG